MDKIEGKPFGQPANDIEKQWLLDRLKTLSAREAYQLAAMMLTTGRLREVSGKEGDELLLAVLKLDRKETTEAINCLLSLSDYQVLCPAGGYESWGNTTCAMKRRCRRRCSPMRTCSRSASGMKSCTQASSSATALWCSPAGNRSRPTMARIWTKWQETDWSLRAPSGGSRRAQGSLGLPARPCLRRARWPTGRDRLSLTGAEGRDHPRM